MQKKPDQYFIIIPLAYLYTGVESLFRLPPYVYIATFFIGCIVASIATLTPLSAAKIQLASSSQSLEDYARFLQLTQASGNDDLNQRIYQNMQPVIDSQPIGIKQKMHDVVFPQIRVEAQLAFWESVYKKQSNSREANGALTVLMYQKFEEDQFQQYFVRWKELEPNDIRLKKIK